MYKYDEYDQTLVDERVAQFRGQVERRLAGELTEDEFRPLRLMNGLYLQLHAYMLRIAVPYGTLSSRQVRKFAHIARRYDRGFGHFTTRQNLQFNWIKLEDTPDILAELASVEMHAMQTSGNCVRNITADQFAGVAADEIEDVRPWAEVIRQWSTLHPEFSFLPRKFKIALSASPHDRAAIKVHDIGLGMTRNSAGEVGFVVYVGGGLGRTPFVGPMIREFLPKAELLGYLEAILRVYNMFGRRDNIFKARIKILVDAVGAEEFTRLVEQEYAASADTAPQVSEDEIARIAAFFQPPAYQRLPARDPAHDRARLEIPAFDRWCRQNVAAHRVKGYAIANISLKPIGGIPGDASADQMDLIADLADRHSFGEVRVTHEQNLVLPDVKIGDLRALWQALDEAGLGAANLGLATDIIACPGLDYCSLANARSIPIAQRISERLGDDERQRKIGDLKIKISGCINACGHHHVGHIGILGVDRKGEENYQILLGGSADQNASLAEVIGPSFNADTVVDGVERIVDTYVALRTPGETFLQTYRRLGPAPFKEKLYGEAANGAA
ncbi:MAG TPA: nitrite/sulfite reductase [Alphaproteobacteria bacterium]